MAQLTKPTVVNHADWGSKEKKRWCARATLGTDGHYTAFAPKLVGNLRSLIEQLRTEAGETGCAFAGFDFPIGIPAFYAKQAGISSFRALFPKLECGQWKDFYSVCDEANQISVHRPFYPNGRYKGKRKQELFRGHGVSSLEPLLRRCERGGNGQRQACCLFWTLGGNQVGKAAIIGWRDVLAPALRNVSLWPFDGPLPSLLVPGSIVVAETYPAECYGWFSKEPLGSKRDRRNRRKLRASLLRWADAKPSASGTPSSPAPNNGNGLAASSGFNQLRNEFLTAARRVATTKKQAIGEVVEWASGGVFKYGDVGRMTEADTPKLRAATELIASALAGEAR